MPAPTVTALPPAPSRSQAPSVFSETADAFVGALVPFATEINTLVAYLNSTAITLGTFSDGSFAIPAIRFTSETNKGIYKKGAGVMGMVGKFSIESEDDLSDPLVFVNRTNPVGLPSGFGKHRITMRSGRGTFAAPTASSINDEVFGLFGEFSQGAGFTGPVAGISAKKMFASSSDLSTMVTTWVNADLGVMYAAMNVNGAGNVAIGKGESSAIARFEVQGEVAITNTGTNDAVLRVGEGRASATRAMVQIFSTPTGEKAELRRNAGVNGALEIGNDGTSGITVPSKMAVGTATAAAVSLDVTGPALFRGVLCEVVNPATKTAAATLTAAEILGGLIVYTGAAAALTLPTGALLDTALAVAILNTTFEFSVVNTGSGAATVTVAAGITSIGALVVAAGTSGRFSCRRTAANTFIVYRLA